MQIKVLRGQLYRFRQILRLQLTNYYALKSFSLALLSLLTLPLSLTGCDFGESTQVQVILLNFEDGVAPIPEVEWYEKMFNGAPGVYRTTPKGRAVPASIQEWFSTISSGRTVAQFKIIGMIDSPRSYADILARDQNGTEWWHAGVVESAIAGARRAGKSFTRDLPLIVLHNGPGFDGWIAGPNIVAKALQNYGSTIGFDLPKIGVILHELGHFYTHQPDRYGFYWGSLREWDNMADHYGDYPSGYSSHGKIRAGYSTWGEWFTQLSGESQTREFESLSSQQEIPRFASEIDPGPYGESSFFTLEVRRKIGLEALSELPAEGALLFETDVADKFTYLPNAIPSPTITDFRHVRAANTFWQIVTNRNDYTKWALPNVDGDTSFDCSTLGTSLNNLGECIWEFKDIEHLPETTRFKSVYHPITLEPLESSGQLRTFEIPYFFEGGARFYLKVSAAMTLNWKLQTAQGQVLQKGVAHLGQTSKSRSRRHILELDAAALQEGAVVLFESSQISSLESVIFVERPLMKPQLGANPLIDVESVTLGSGQSWLNPRAKLQGNAQSETKLNFVVNDPGNTVLNGFYRFTLGWDESALGTDSKEEVNVIVCYPFQPRDGALERKCINRGNFLLSTARSEPLIFQHSLGSQPGFEFELIRKASGVTVPLHILSADFVVHPVRR